MIGGLILGGGGMLLIVAAPDIAVVAVAMLVAQQIISDPGWTVFKINQTSLRQAIAPEGVLGRVTSAERFAGLVATLVASIVAGVIASYTGARFVLGLGALCAIVGALIIFLSPLRNARDVPVTITEVLAA